jgi:ssDNA thymidine ADP-ribosyltransferase, DarT
MAALRISDLTAKRGMIFRITHIRNLPWILENGLHCARSNRIDPNFVPIGNADLINKRMDKSVPHEMGGTLADYVPFYFTPRSPMLRNIVTGYNGVAKRSNSEIIVLVSTVAQLVEKGLQFLISDRHAIYAVAEFSSDPAFLERIDWQIPQKSDFRRDDVTDPDKFERYMAETLIKTYAPIDALIGIACSDVTACQQVESNLRKVNSALKVAIRKDWYF